MNAVNGMNEEVIEEGDSANRIAVISVEGAIMNVPQASFLTESYDHKATLNALDDILEDDTIKGVLLKVNSPGGGVYESAELHKRIKAIVDAKKPVYVAMGNTAASGGYYISAPATKNLRRPPPSPAPSASLWVAPIFRALWINWASPIKPLKAPPTKTSAATPAP